MSSTSKKWSQFIIGIAAIALFISVIVPIFSQNETSARMLEYIEEEDIDTRALFYTESEEAVQAEFLMRQLAVGSGQ